MPVVYTFVSPCIAQLSSGSPLVSSGDTAAKLQRGGGVVPRGHPPTSAERDAAGSLLSAAPTTIGSAVVEWAVLE